MHQGWPLLRASLRWPRSRVSRFARKGADADAEMGNTVAQLSMTVGITIQSGDGGQAARKHLETSLRYSRKSMFVVLLHFRERSATAATAPAESVRTQYGRGASFRDTASVRRVFSLYLSSRLRV